MAGPQRVRCRPRLDAVDGLVRLTFGTAAGEAGRLTGPVAGASIAAGQTPFQGRRTGRRATYVQRDGLPYTSPRVDLGLGEDGIYGEMVNALTISASVA